MRLVNLFLIHESKIAVLKLHNDKLSFIREDGEKFQAITEKFGAWWAKKAGYVTGDELDLCFVWDRLPPVLQHPLKITNETADKATLTLFTPAMRDDTQWDSAVVMELLQDELGEDITLKPYASYQKEQGRANVFYTNVAVAISQEQDISPDPSPYAKAISEGSKASETPMQRYYREMRESEMKKR